MLTSKHLTSARRVGALVVGAAAFTMLVSACATPSSGGSLTLVETKSPVQLLRNEALDRVETRFVLEVRNATDTSVACTADGDNPDGLIRQWESSAEVVLAEGAHRDYVAERLVQSFTGDGWDDENISGRAVLSKDHSLASIEIESDDSSPDGTVRITVTGPCVMTAGPDSDEVTSLEQSPAASR